MNDYLLIIKKWWRFFSMKNKNYQILRREKERWREKKKTHTQMVKSERWKSVKEAERKREKSTKMWTENFEAKNKEEKERQRKKKK